MPRRDDALLLDMLLACRKIRAFVGQRSQADFEHDELLQSALIREFQVLGEASRLVSDQTKASHDDIPWATIRALRNRLVHEYFAIRLDVLWDTIQNDIPPLMEQLERMVPPEGEDE
jgi:uncharacterized protein with HEPN domain